MIKLRFLGYLTRRKLFIIGLSLSIFYLLYQLTFITALSKLLASRSLEKSFTNHHPNNHGDEDNYVDDDQLLSPLKGSPKVNYFAKDSFKKNTKRRPVKPLGKIILGVSKFDFKYYQEKDGGQFRCRSSGEEISYSQVNDDYCDCQDGSDEPSTDACPQFKFYCIVKTFNGLTSIPSSMVNDGICDCCDGSDEYLNRSTPAITFGGKLTLPSKGVYLTPCKWRCSS
ncbi:transmembrane cell adhesion receptor mua-3-like isoform X1 [Panonychus citri]|uniref:transmembrane cell adhesion receptor mua-3-like isoform X1 n=1 Tax=Panonychus citri TaxID=50023 RepID=UPI0023080D1D|nr:transmembrane cell adhesion receptor mua-3-like isoform X1 [Panonychus citri]